MGWMDIKCGIWQLHKTKTDMQASSEQLSKIMTRDGHDAIWRTNGILYDKDGLYTNKMLSFSGMDGHKLWDTATTQTKTEMQASSEQLSKIMMSAVSIPLL